MLRAASGLNGYSIAAKDGLIGHVNDVLFDDDTSSSKRQIGGLAKRF